MDGKSKVIDRKSTAKSGGSLIGITKTLMEDQAPLENGLEFVGNFMKEENSMENEHGT